MNPGAESLPASIIIATHNRREDLRECLGSLPWEQLDKLGGEVIVNDDGCTDGTADMVGEAFPAVQLLINKKNEGLAYCRNRSGRAARGNMLLYLDDDVVVAPGWLDAMLAADDGETVLGGRILNYSDGQEQGGPARSTFVGKRLPCGPEKATVGTGCNLGIPARCFEKLGGFDEDLPYYFEDSDLCIRARRAGYRFKYVAGGVVRHKGSPVKKGEAIRMQERNSTYAMLKAYRGHTGKLAIFTLANGLWLVIRLVSWGGRLRLRDCRLLFCGWWEAYRRYWTAGNLSGT